MAPRRSLAVVRRRATGTDAATTFAGELDDIRMYTGVMSEAQIYQQWSNG
ncbi:hypothetical protein [Actinopolymorpha pittospori]